jgi:hypothetical protein
MNRFVALALVLLVVSGCEKDEARPVPVAAEPAGEAQKAPVQPEPVEKFSLYRGEEDEFVVEVPSDLSAIKVKQSQGPEGKWRTNEYRVDASRFIGGIMIRCQKFAVPGIPEKNVKPMLKEGIGIWREGKTLISEEEVKWSDAYAIRARMKQEHKGMTVYSDYLLAYLPSNRTAYTAMFISGDLQVLDGEEGKKFFDSFKHVGKE